MTYCRRDALMAGLERLLIRCPVVAAGIRFPWVCHADLGATVYAGGAGVYADVDDDAPVMDGCMRDGWMDLPSHAALRHVGCNGSKPAMEPSHGALLSP